MKSLEFLSECLEFLSECLEFILNFLNFAEDMKSIQITN